MKANVNKIDLEKVERSPESKTKPKVNLSDELAEIKAQINFLGDHLRNCDKRGSDRYQKDRKNGGKGRSRKCKLCEQNKEEKCDHCFYCGSSEHFFVGCRKRRSDKEKSNSKNEE